MVGRRGRLTSYFPATNRWAYRSTRPEERTNRRAFPGFPRPCPLPSPQVSRLRWPLRVQTPHSLQSPGMSLFSRSLACFWLTGLTPPPSPSCLGHPDKKQRFHARLPPTPSRKPILGTQSARPFLKQPGLPKSKRENEYLVFLEGFPIQVSYVTFVRLDLQASGCSCHSRCSGDRTQARSDSIAFLSSGRVLTTYCVKDTLPTPGGRGLCLEKLLGE